MIGQKVTVKRQGGGEESLVDRTQTELKTAETEESAQSQGEDALAELTLKLEQTRLELTQAQEHAQRRLADYHNLVRRTQEDRAKLIKLASRDFISDMLEPLSHLKRAAEQINDKGLHMVIKQLWQKLEQNGLKELDVLGKPFNLATMEVVETEGDGDDVVVTKVVTPGYELNGEVIAHAKVVLGKKSN